MALHSTSSVGLKTTDAASSLTAIDVLQQPYQKPQFSNLWSRLPLWATKERYRGDLLAVIVTFHVIALVLAPFTVTWQGLVAFAVMYVLTGSLGIGFCYHRMLTHKAFECAKPFKYFSTLMGALTLEGGPLWWVATHRLHHRESDQPMDSHSPVQQGFMWSHVGWLLYDHPEFEKDGMTRDEVIRRYAPDIAQDPVIAWIEKYNLHLNIALLLGLFAIGTVTQNWYVGLSMMVWGGFLRIVWMWNWTWCVNSACHIWGYRNYETRENSKNNWFVALFSFGEGWHNNHHADQRAARNGQRWFEIDATYCVIKALSWIGVTSKIVPFRQKLPKHGQVIDLR